jgi:hypothetical protein
MADVKSLERERRAWHAMRARCVAPDKASAYLDRGITVCARDSCAAFIFDVGLAPSPSHWLERRDNDRGYEPDNVGWATIQEQTRNRRSNRRLTHNGLTLTIAAWAERVGLSATVLYARAGLGWSADRILTMPLRAHRTTCPLGHPYDRHRRCPTCINRHNREFRARQKERMA